MADDKKEKGKSDKKDEKKGGAGIEAVEIFILIVLILAFAVLYNFSGYFKSFLSFFGNKAPTIAIDINGITHTLSDISLVISAALSIGIIYSIVGLLDIRHKEKSIMDARIQEAFLTAAQAGDKELAIRWRTILDLTESANPNDWRQSIVDADTVLDQILKKGGFVGDSLGERLTNATKGDIKSLDQAWEAHKVRNIIAHEGSNYVLTQHEAKRVINLYKQVFEEFYFI